MSISFLLESNKNSTHLGLDYKIVSKKDKIGDTVIITKYHARKRVSLTADGSKINLKHLNSYRLRWVAISRNLLKKYSLGDTIFIRSKNKNITGRWVIKDLMHRKWKNKIDILVPRNDNYKFHRPHKVIIYKESA